MTDPYTSQPATDDIDEPVESFSADLDREADEILAQNESRTFDAPPLREAVRRDAESARDWGQQRVERFRGVVENEPMKATLIALGIGVVIGLLAAR